MKPLHLPMRLPLAALVLATLSVSARRQDMGTLALPTRLSEEQDRRLQVNITGETDSEPERESFAWSATLELYGCAPLRTTEDADVGEVSASDNFSLSTILENLDVRALDQREP